MTMSVSVIRDGGDPDPQRRYKMAYGMWRAQTCPPCARPPAQRNPLDRQPGRCAPRRFAGHCSPYKYNGLYVSNGRRGPTARAGGGWGARGWPGSPSASTTGSGSGADSFARDRDPSTAGLPLEHGRRMEAPPGRGAGELRQRAGGAVRDLAHDEWFASISGDLGRPRQQRRSAVPGAQTLKGLSSSGPGVTGPARPRRNYPPSSPRATGSSTWARRRGSIHRGRWRNAAYECGVPVDDYYAEVALATIPRDRWGAVGVNPILSEGVVCSTPVVLPPTAAGSASMAR